MQLKTTGRNPLPRFTARVLEKAADYKSGPPLLIVALGDSITMGATANDFLIPQFVYHNRLKARLEQRFDGLGFPVSVINAGIGCDTAATALPRLADNVIRYQPDLAIVAFGANELGDPGAFAENLKEIIRRIKTQTRADIVLMTPNFVASRVDKSLNAEDAAFAELLTGYQRDGTLERVAQIVRDTAKREKLPVAEVTERWRALEKAGTDTTAMLSNLTNHPNALGHALMADALGEVVLKAIDAAGLRPAKAGK